MAEWMQILVPLVVAGVVGVAAFGLKGLHKNTVQRVDRIEADIRDHRRNNDAKFGEIHRDYARREDLIREAAAARQKLDQLIEAVAELRGKEDTVIAVANEVVTHLRRGNGNG